jgi:transposase-like protein
VERPPYDVIVRETAALGFSAVGRKYGVSDNAVRKWIRWYEAHGDACGGSDEPLGGLEEAA